MSKTNDNREELNLRQRKSVPAIHPSIHAIWQDVITKSVNPRSVNAPQKNNDFTSAT